MHTVVLLSTDEWLFCFRSDDIKSVQNHGVDGDCIPVLLETMDICSKGFELTESGTWTSSPSLPWQSGNLTYLSSIAANGRRFQRALSGEAHPGARGDFLHRGEHGSQWGQARGSRRCQTIGTHTPGNWNSCMITCIHSYIHSFNIHTADICEEVVHCFKSDDIEECKARVRKNKTSWSNGLAERMDSISPKLLKVSVYGYMNACLNATFQYPHLSTYLWLSTIWKAFKWPRNHLLRSQEWFHLTRYAKEVSQEEYGKKEIDIVRSL